jgi:hypothetical protein
VGDMACRILERVSISAPIYPQTALRNLTERGHG